MSNSVLESASASRTLTRPAGADFVCQIILRDSNQRQQLPSSATPAPSSGQPPSLATAAHAPPSQPLPTPAAPPRLPVPDSAQAWLEVPRHPPMNLLVRGVRLSHVLTRGAAAACRGRQAAAHRQHGRHR